MVPTDTPFSVALSSPHELINDLARTTPKSDLHEAVSKAFQSAFTGEDALRKVPYLSTGNVESLIGKTVRWICMVQDNSLGNEIVMSTLPARGSAPGQSALYGGDTAAAASQETSEEDNASSSQFEASTNDLSERAVLYGVSLPGRTPWAAQADVEATNLLSGSASSSSSQTDPKISSTANRGIESKLPNSQDPQAIGVMLKMYDLSAAESLQVSDIIEVIGVLDRSSFDSSEWQDDSVGSQDTTQNTCPCLHIVSHKKMSDVWSTGGGGVDESGSDAETSAMDAETLRNGLLGQLTEDLGGDSTGAEWVLLSLIASIHTRKTPFALGHLSLRLLSTTSSEVSTSLHRTLSNLLPNLSSIRLTLPTLNDSRTHFYPESKPTSSTGLSSSQLQLAKSSTIVINESITEGNLSEHGLKNLTSLGNVLKNQSLGYQFPYLPQPFEMPVDFNLILISQIEQDSTTSGGGLVTCDVDVLLQSDATFTPSSGTSTLPENLTTLRKFISTCRSKARKLHIPPSVAEEIQSDFVQSRRQQQQPQQSAKEDDLQATLLRRMDVARLLAASYLRNELTFQDYLNAKNMDTQRLHSFDSRRLSKK
ncbi:unnamed protein product [Sympodiomycopsis kandeliae]